MELCFIHFNKEDINITITDKYLLTKEKKSFALNRGNLEEIRKMCSRTDETVVLGYDLQKFLAYCLEKFSYYFVFSYFDILRLYRAFYGIKEEPSLEDLAYDYGIELDEFNHAKSMYEFLLEDSGFDSEYFLHGFFGDCRLDAKAAGQYQSLINDEFTKRSEIINGLLNNDIEGIFVFDFECANNDKGIGKICELGALYLDSNFNLIEEVEYLINPESEFRLGTDISLFYSENQYRSSPKLPKQYEKFKKYFEDPKILKIGYSVGNDINFLLTDLNRYKNVGPKFICFDVQPLVNNALNSDNSVGLGNANLALLGDLDSNREHRALDDSKLTLRLFQYFLHDENLKDFLTSNKDCFCSSINLIELRENRLPVLAYW